jgi:ankyrin repeat protein
VKLRFYCYTYLPYKLYLNYIIKEGYEDVLKELLRHRELTHGHVETTWSWAPLHYAVQHGEIGMVRCLLDHGFDINSMLVPELHSPCPPCTPLYYAITGGQPDMVAFLLDHGAEVERINGEMSAILVAVYNHRPGMLETLRNKGRLGGDINLIHEGWSLLHLGFQSFRLEESEQLLDLLLSFPTLKKETINMLDRNGKTILAKVTAHRHALRSLGSNPGLEYARFEDIVTRIVAKLLSFGADPNIEIPNPRSETPLHHAARRGNVRMVRTLLEYGADASKRDWRYGKPYFAALETTRLFVTQPPPPRYEEIMSILREADGHVEH